MPAPRLCAALYISSSLLLRLPLKSLLHDDDDYYFLVDLDVTQDSSLSDLCVCVCECEFWQE